LSRSTCQFKLHDLGYEMLHQSCRDATTARKVACKPDQRCCSDRPETQRSVPRPRESRRVTSPILPSAMNAKTIRTVHPSPMRLPTNSAVIRHRGQAPHAMPAADGGLSIRQPVKGITTKPRWNSWGPCSSTSRPADACSRPGARYWRS
jgi:hypothetical protein